MDKSDMADYINDYFMNVGKVVESKHKLTTALELFRPSTLSYLKTYLLKSQYTLKCLPALRSR